MAAPGDPQMSITSRLAFLPWTGKLYYSAIVTTACSKHGAQVRQAAACARSKGVISVLRIMCIDSPGVVVGQARSSQRASALVTCRCRALEALSPRSRKTRGVAQASRAGKGARSHLREWTGRQQCIQTPQRTESAAAASAGQQDERD